jgi:hypothetical protein
MSDLLRVYLDPAEIGPDGYPYAWYAWHKETRAVDQSNRHPEDGPRLEAAIKDHVRELAGNRCVRCGHPYKKGAGEWSPCDVYCTHGEPIRRRDISTETRPPGATEWVAIVVEAQWRILTVHHLNGIKHDCRWWNLVALCQRCHLTIQAKVHLERAWHLEHSEWFKPYAAGYYASTRLGEELTREQTVARLDELLALEHRQETLL